MDDGAKDLEESKRLIEQLFIQGVSGAACTSHFYPLEEQMEHFVERRDSAMSLLKERKIVLYAASETYLHACLLYYDTLKPLCIENTCYLLFELPFSKRWGKEVFDLIEKLMQHFEIIPIIAHVERYPASTIGNVRKLKKLGCIIQINSSSLFQKEYKRKCIWFMKKELIDILGSDCHDSKTRPPKLSMAFEVLENKFGLLYCYQLVQNSHKVPKGINIT